MAQNSFSSALSAIEQHCDACTIQLPSRAIRSTDRRKERLGLDQQIVGCLLLASPHRASG